MKKNLIIITYIIFNAFISFGQKTNKELECSNIYINKKGFIVVGFSKEEKETVFNLIQYDKNLKEINSISPPQKISQYTCKIYPYGYEFQFKYNLSQTKGAFLKVDNDLKLISYIEYDKADSDVLKEDFYHPDPNNHYASANNIFKMQSESSLEIGDYLLEIFHDKASPVIVCYKRKQTELFQNYNKVWEIELVGHKNRAFHFYSGSDGKAYLYLSDLEKNNDEYFFCFNYNSGKLLFELKLELSDTNLKTACSNFLIDHQDNSVVIAGNYYSEINPEKNPETMDGYFIIHVDENGKIIGKKSMKFDFQFPSDMKKDALDRKSMSFQKIVKNAKGNYQLLGENMRLYTYSGVATGQYVPGSPTTYSHYSGNSYQTFGFTFLEFDSNLNLIDSKYEHVRRIEYGNFIELNKKSPSNGEITYTIFELVLKGEKDLPFKYKYCVSNNNISKLIYLEPKNYYLAMKHGNSEISQAYYKDIDVKDFGGTMSLWPINYTLFFEGDDTHFYLFNPNKNSFVLEKRMYE